MKIISFFAVKFYKILFSGGFSKNRKVKASQKVFPYQDLAVYTNLERIQKRFLETGPNTFLWAIHMGTLIFWKDKNPRTAYKNECPRSPADASRRRLTLRSFSLPPYSPSQSSLASSVFSQSGSSHVLTSLDTGGFIHLYARTYLSLPSNTFICCS
jgi:hypothetical protein